MRRSLAETHLEKLIAPVDQYELAIRLLEAAGNLKRPAGSNAREALDGLHAEDRAAWMRAARAALLYFGECISHADRAH